LRSNSLIVMVSRRRRRNIPTIWNSWVRISWPR